MPLAHKTALLSVHDAKVRLLTEDPPSGTATYGDWVDLPDVTSVNLEGDTDVKIRRGDGVDRDKRSVLTGLTLTVENTAFDIDLLAALEGGTIVDAGTGATESWTYSFSGNSRPAYVMFQAKTDGTDFGADGDVHLKIYKCQLNNKVSFGYSDDDFQTVSYELGVVARNSDNKYYDIVGNRTAVAIDAVA